jgi:transposase
MSNRHSLCPPQRYPVADVAARTRVWVGDDVLASSARLATGGCVGSHPLRALDWLARHDQIDWSRAVVDSCSVRAVHGGMQTGPNPTDRAKRGSKGHLICDGRGVPLAVRLTGANRHDSQEALSLVDAIPPLQGERGRGTVRTVLGDRAYDAAVIRQGLRARHILPLLAMRRTKHGSGLDRWRWVVERTFVAQPVSTLARPLRQPGRHPRGVPLALVRADLLAVAAQDVEDGLSGCPPSPWDAGRFATRSTSPPASVRAVTAHHLRPVPFPSGWRPSPGRRFPGESRARRYSGLPGARHGNRSTLRR